MSAKPLRVCNVQDVTAKTIERMREEVARERWRRNVELLTRHHQPISNDDRRKIASVWRMFR